MTYLNKLKSNKDSADHIGQILQNILGTLKGSESSLRISSIKFCLNFLKTTIKEKQELEDLEYLIWKMEVIANYKILIEKNTECSFLYWSADLFESFFQYFNENHVIFLICF